MAMSASIEVEIAGMRWRNPVAVASGTFGYGWQFENFFDVGAELGAIICKGVAARPWAGNPAPRICETPAGIMNSVGLQNPGVEAFCATYGEYLSSVADRGCHVIVQAAGHSVEELAEATALFDERASWASAIEINVSCPNLKRGGALIGGTPADCAAAVAACRAKTEKPLIVKMAPVDTAAIGRAAQEAGADALDMINTISGMSIDVETRTSRLSRPTGGVSGPAIHPIAVRMVWEAASAVDVPIIGCGGIASWEDAAEMVLVGATGVSVGTANLTEPLAARDIARGLAAWTERQGAASITELRGAFSC